MRARAQNIQQVKDRIAGLKGKSLSVSVNKGRKKTVSLDGVITDIFPSVFTFKATAGDPVTFSYSDVICGDVVIGAVDVG